MSEPFTVQVRLGGFAIFWRDADGKPHKQQLAATDRASAEAEARTRWYSAGEGPWTVGRIIAAYLRDREDAGIVDLKRLQNAWKAMASFWAPILPENIDTKMCQAYALRRKVAPATVRKELAMLAVALRFASKQKFIANVPDVWRPAAPERVDRHLTKPQFVRFLNGCVAPHMRLYAVVAVCTAARPSAVLQIVWDRVDFERKQIDLNPLGRVQTIKRRPVVAINDIALAVLKEAYPARTSDNVVAWAGHEIASIKKAFQAASKRSGVRATPYTLRHTAAVWMAEGGVPMEQIQQFMGHEDLQTTIKYYARFSPEFLRNAANAISW